MEQWIFHIGRYLNKENFITWQIGDQGETNNTFFVHIVRGDFGEMALQNTTYIMQEKPKFKRVLAYQQKMPLF